MDYKIYKDKKVLAAEFSALMKSVGWGDSYDQEAVTRSVLAYPFVAHARNGKGQLVGYVSAFSDSVFSTMLGELVVAPLWQRQGIGKALLAVVENEYRNVPIYVKPIGEAKRFFLACGYREPSIEMCVLFKKNEMLANTAFDTGAAAPVN